MIVLAILFTLASACILEERIQHYRSARRQNHPDHPRTTRGIS